MPSAEATQLATCTYPLAAVAVGDVVSYARPGERRPLMRHVTGVTRRSIFRPEINVWDELVAVTLAIHPTRQSAKSGTDTITGWSHDGIDVAVEVPS